MTHFLNLPFALDSSIYRLGDYGIVKISGNKASEFLQGQLTCDMNQITEEHGSLGALCNPQGRVLAVFYIFKREEDYFCLLLASILPSFLQHLQKFAVFSKVHLEEDTQNSFLYASIDKNAFGAHHSFAVKLTDQLSNYFCITNNELKNDSEDIDTWKLINISRGLAPIYPSTQSCVTPHMLNLHNLGAISFAKGCYVGQEIIARTQYLGKTKRHLCRAKLQNEISLLPGELIYSGGSEAGMLMDSVVRDGNTSILAVLHEPLDREFSLLEVALEEIESHLE